MMRLALGLLALGAGQAQQTTTTQNISTDVANVTKTTVASFAPVGKGGLESGEDGDEVYLSQEGVKVSVVNTSKSFETQIELSLPADTMIMEHDRAYFLGRGFEIFDLAKADRPVRIFSDPTAFYNKNEGERRQMTGVVHDSILYMVIDGASNFSLSATDFSNPKEPRPLSLKENAMPELPRKMVADGQILAMANSRGVSFYDISDETKVFFLSNVEIDHVTDLTLKNGIAQAYSHKKVTIINANDPLRPFVVGGDEPRPAQTIFIESSEEMNQSDENSDEQNDQAIRKQGATQKPTRRPTRAPTTRRPTQKPTTKAPTIRPTKAPTPIG